MTDGRPVTLVGACGVQVTITPKHLAQVAATDMPEDQWLAHLTGEGHPEWVEHMPTWWTVEYGDAPPCGGRRLRLAVVTANAAAGGACAIECVRPCPIANLIAAVEVVDGPRIP